MSPVMGMQHRVVNIAGISQELGGPRGVGALAEGGVAVICSCYEAAPTHFGGRCGWTRLWVA